MNKVHVKKNDQVVVISGPKDGDKAIKGKQGKILTVDPKAGKVIVEGRRLCHQAPEASAVRASRAASSRRSCAIDASNVMLICPKCGKATRVAPPRDRGGARGRLQEEENRPRLQAPAKRILTEEVR